MGQPLIGVLAAVVSYFFGGIPVGLLVGRSRGIDDIRKYGSGNIGASNVLRIIGVKAGLMVWLADALKGFIPVAVATHVLGLPGWWVAVVAVTAMLGHCFSPYLRLTGGRGVSTSLGVLIGLDWRVGLTCFIIWIVIVAVTRYISLGSMVASGLAAPLFWLYGQHAPAIAAGGILAGIVVWRHAANISRLLAGTERKIGRREDLPAEESP